MAQYDGRTLRGKLWRFETPAPTDLDIPVLTKTMLSLMWQREERPDGSYIAGLFILRDKWSRSHVLRFPFLRHSRVWKGKGTLVSQYDEARDAVYRYPDNSLVFYGVRLEPIIDHILSDRHRVDTGYTRRVNKLV